MDSVAAGVEFPSLALLSGRVEQSRKPPKRRRHGSSVFEVDGEHLRGQSDIRGSNRILRICGGHTRLSADRQHVDPPI